jgi:competence protein ComEC
MKKIIFACSFATILLVGIFSYQWFKFHDGKLHVVFCDVGQGDGILITTPSNKQILIDAGPDSRILDCLSKHMPFWDRKIELALLTHPHADHFTGYYYVIDRYSIDQFASEELKNKSDGFAQLENQLKQHLISLKYVYAGDRWKIASSQAPRNDVIIEVMAPTREFIFGQNPDGFITNSAESASLVAKISHGDFSVLVTGDAPVDLMKEVVNKKVGDLDLLQIPHHGSNTGINGEVLDILKPHLAVISVGKNNYGHPTKRTLDLLSERGIKVLRTDQIGDVELVSDGKNIELN